MTKGKTAADRFRIETGGEFIEFAKKYNKGAWLHGAIGSEKKPKIIAQIKG
jgi:hypothetical protein